jgi:hypothetical protein
VVILLAALVGCVCCADDATNAVSELRLQRTPLISWLGALRALVIPLYVHNAAHYTNSKMPEKSLLKGAAPLITTLPN